jgi:transcriptional regulator with XRE-family HTH domain
LEAIGASLAAARTARGMTQAQLARTSKVSTTTINELETRRCRDVRLSTLVALAESLAIPTTSLLPVVASPVSSKEHAHLIRASEEILSILKRMPHG